MASPANPVLSVLVSAREAGEPLARTLRSVAAQSFPSIDVILSGPADVSSQNWREAGAERFPRTTLETLTYGAEAWNISLAKASGEYVC
jgi:hypothetical protein